MLLAVALTFVGLSLCRAAAPASIREDLQQNRQSLQTLNPANNRWKAQSIGVAGPKAPFTFQEDYASTTYGQAWDFQHGLPPKLKGWTHVENFGIAEGRLCFTTQSDAEVFWGDYHQRNPEYGEETIGQSWWRHWMPIRVKIRLRQSLPKSDWVVSLRKGNAGWDKFAAKKFTLKGTDWREINLGVCDSRTFYAALCLKTAQAGNRVEIDSLSVYTPHLTRVYRTVFDLDDAVEDAAFCVAASPSFKVRINGRLAVSGNRGGILHRYTDVGKHFRKGRNELVVEAEAKNWSGDQDGLVLEGIIRGASGKIKSLQTDGDWQGQYLPAAGKVDETAWKPVKNLGKVTGRFGDSGGAFYLNPPHYGRLQAEPAGRDQPIFPSGKPIEFQVNIFGRNLLVPADVRYRVTDALDHDRQLVAGQLIKSVANRRQKSRLTFKPAHPGVYNITVELREIGSGKLLEDCLLEAVSVGRIHQREIAGVSATEGLELKLQTEIDCVGAQPPLSMISTSRTGKAIKPQITTGPMGSFLASGNQSGDLFSWKLEFPNCRRPYLVEIDYPDDTDRIMGISLGGNSQYQRIRNDHGEASWPFAASGVYTGFQNPVSHRMRTLRMIVYPQLPVSTLEVVNLLAGSRAAVSRIRVFEITNDLPAIRFASPASRLTGVHAERITEIPNTYYQGDMDRVFADGHSLCSYPFQGFYKTWYQTNVNLIKHMRFCGENTLVAGLVMYYSGFMYPSSKPDDLLYLNTAQADMATLLGEMFAANDLTLLLGVEYSLPAKLYRQNRVTDEMVGLGEPTFSAVGRDGKQVMTWHKIGNINESEIEEDLYQSMADLCALYKDNPGIKGIVFQEGSAYNPCFPLPPRQFDPLYSDYSDTTMARFERDTGLKVKAPAVGSDRFRQRYEWLMNEAREAWIDWRCRRIHHVNRTIAEMMKKANSSWTAYIFHDFSAESVFKQNLSFTEFQRRTGFFPPMYQDPVFCVGRYYQESIRHQSGNPERYAENQAFTSSPEVVAMFNKGMKRTALRTGPQFYEPWLSQPAGQWYWNRTLLGAYCLPPDENIPRLYNRLLHQETPYFLLQYWTDMNLPCGFEHERRLFNRAFCVIPEGDYQDLRGEGLDANTIIRASDRHFYAINLLPVELKLNLRASGASEIRDLATGEVYPLGPGHSAQIILRPHGLGAFSLDRGRLQSAVSVCPPQLIQECRERLGEISSLSQSLQNKLRRGEIPAKDRDIAQEFSRFTSALQTACDSHRYGWTLTQLNGFRLKKLLSQVRDLATPINWMIIGPFDNPRRQAFEQVLPVEKDLLNGIMEKRYTGLGKRNVTWHKVVAGSAGKFRGIVNLLSLYGDKCDFQLAYATGQVFVPKATPARLLLGSDDGLKVWVNAQQVFSIKPKRGLTPAENNVDITLRQGWNQIVLKIENNVGGWGFSLDIKDRGNEDISSLEYARNQQ
jgi:hypothetical protein